MKKINWRNVLEEFPLPQEDPGVKGEIEGELSPPKVVLFDVYGTLVKPLIGDLEAQLRNQMSVESFEETIRRFGLPKGIGEDLYRGFYSKINEVHESLRTLGIKQPEVLIEHVWMELLAEKDIRISVEDARSLAIFREMKANPVAAFSGAGDCLKKLKQRNIKLGIVSNSQFYTMPILGRALKIDLDQVFDREIVFLSYELGFAKPDPYFFLLVRTKLAITGTDPGEVVVVGNDWINDIMASRKFGFQALFFRGEGREQEYDPATIGDGCAVVFNYNQVKTLLGIRG